MENRCRKIILALGLSVTVCIAPSWSQDSGLPYEIKSGQRISAAGLNANFLRLQQQYEHINAELERARKTIQKLETEQASYLSSLDGAVLAFDRSEKSGACPRGWSPFEPAGGRFLVGAGIHRNVDANGELLNVYPSYSSNSEESVGGEARHTLSESELPPHTHVYRSTDNGPLHDNRSNFIGGAGRFGQVGEKSTNIVGGGEAHNNIPPYIAVYFCKLNN